MKKRLDKLSRDLASGMTRRDALRLFFSGIGAAAVGVFSGRLASADGNAICVQLCRDQGLHGRDFGKCVSASAHCPPGECALCINGVDNCVCVPVDGNPVCVALCREQGFEGSDLVECVSASADCPDGQCAVCINDIDNCVCTPVGS